MKINKLFLSFWQNNGVFLLILLILLITVKVLFFGNFSTAQAQAASCQIGSLQAVSLDGVDLRVCLPFMPDHSSSANNEDWVQAGSWTKITPHQEFSIYVIPYGINPAADNLPSSFAGITDKYKKSTKDLYEPNSLLYLAGPSISVFGSNVQGDTYFLQNDIDINSSNKKMITEWIVESGNRVWIIRSILYVDFSKSEIWQSAIETLNTISIESQTLGNSSISLDLHKNSPAFMPTPSQSGVQPLNDLASPNWWDGECDTNRYLRITGTSSYRLGATFRGLVACGPGGVGTGINKYGLQTPFGSAGGTPQLEFQCAELPKRYLWLLYAIPPKLADGFEVVNKYDNALPNLKKVANGTANSGLAAGDIISYNGPGSAGHTAIVTSVTIDGSGNGSYSTIEQNSSSGGYRTNTISNWYLNSNSGISVYLHDTNSGGGSSCPGPSLNSPNDGYVSTGQTVSFSWAGLSGCNFNGYTFRIKDTSSMDSGGNTLVDTGNSSTSRSENISTQWNNKDLYWGIRAANAPNGASWSVRRFRIEPGSSGCSPNADQVALFVDSNYGGTCVVKGTGNYSNPSSLGISNDSISSIKVGSNVRLTLCKDDNYLGGCDQFTGDDSNLSDNGIGDNQASSGKVESRGSSCTNGATPGALPSGYSFCANEGSGNTCTFSGQASVAYGANNCYFYKASTNSVICSNEIFGDPISGTGKSCYYKITLQAPSAPVLSQPGNNSSNAYNFGLNFQWNAASNASEYLLEWWGGPYSATQPCSWSYATSCYIGNVIAGNTYYWHVKARNSAGNSDWSNTWVFTVQSYPNQQLAVSKSGQGSGTVTSSPAGINCGGTCSYSFGYNTSVTLTASTSSPSSFAGWSGAGCSGTGSCVVIMSSAQSVTATFNTTPLPSPEFDAWPQQGEAPFTSAMHIVNTNYMKSCYWEYGDGETGTSCESQHNHTYINPGVYDVKLTVTGDAGSDSMTRTGYITVTPGASALAEISLSDFSFSPSTPNINQAINVGISFSNTSDKETGAFWVDMYFDRQPSGTCPDSGEYWVRADPLLANSSQAQVISIPAGSLSEGTHQIYFFLDSSCEVDEINESDNIVGPFSVTVVAAPAPIAFTSGASQDGFVLETSEFSNIGGVIKTTGNLQVGDDVLNKQYRSLLSFNTSALPDNAVITNVILKIKKVGVIGKDPFTWAGNKLLADIRTGYFYTSNALQANDFQANANKKGIGPFNVSSGWYQVVMKASDFSYINLYGLTQFRLYFVQDDNNNKRADYTIFYSGDTAAANRPTLVVEYSLP